jgi:hypothetical protein
MKRIEIDNCYQCLYYQTLGGQSCGKIVGTKLLTAKEAKNIPDWCPLPDVKECEHPFASVHTRCMGEINHCLRCGKDL